MCVGTIIGSGISDIFYIGWKGSYIVFLSWCLAWCGFSLHCFDGHLGVTASYQGLGRVRDWYAKDSGDISISMRSMKSAIKQTSMVLTQSDARAEIQEAVYHFVNDHGFPVATTEKPQFLNLLTYIIDNSSLIKAEDLHLGNKAILEMWITSFNEFVLCIAQLMSTSLKTQTFHLATYRMMTIRTNSSIAMFYLQQQLQDILFESRQTRVFKHFINWPSIA